MADETHIFKVSSVWQGNSDGDGSLAADGWKVEYGVPAALGGKAGRANPEELLLGAVVSCYCITLSILAERKRLPLERIEVDAECDVERQLGGTLKLTAIRLSPRLFAAGLDESQTRALTDAAHKAEQYCVVSNALRGNAQVTVVPEILTA